VLAAFGIFAVGFLMRPVGGALIGYIGDRFGRRAALTFSVAAMAIPTFLVGAIVLGFVGALPFFWLMHHADPAVALLGQLGFVLAVGTFVGTQPAIMVEAALVAVRCTAIAHGYNVTLGLVGGLSPLAATGLVSRTGKDYSPAFMIMAAAAISFSALLAFKETYRAPLQTA
jgi:MHS family proline/betaine transporter-like MFS transporter